MTVEDANYHGKVDMRIEFNSQYFLFEFTVVEDQPEGNALQQIKNKGYSDKYRGTNWPIYLVGVAFSKSQR